MAVATLDELCSSATLEVILEGVTERVTLGIEWSSHFRIASDSSVNQSYGHTIVALRPDGLQYH
jgi:hypothetical protein